MQFRSTTTAADSATSGMTAPTTGEYPQATLGHFIRRFTRIQALQKLGGALSLALALLANPLAAASLPAASGLQVGSLTCDVPGELSEFVLHGTLPISPRDFVRKACPLKVYAPNGQALNTQWELVAEMQDWMVVEVRALVENNAWDGMQTFTVFDGETNRFDLSDFEMESFDTVLLPNEIKLNLLDQAGQLHSMTVSGQFASDELYRLGPNTITMERNFNSEFGGLQVWLTMNAGRRQVDLLMNWHNGGLPATPDIYFSAVTLDVPDGWSYTAVMPDPVVGPITMVKPDLHIMPQRMERSFRLILHPDEETPLIELEGWATADWSQGGFMPQNIGLPDLSHTVVDLSVQKDMDYSLLASNSPTIPGDFPESPLWPAQGVRYGGMTSGTEIHHYEGVLPAVSGQADGILSLYVQQLRYGARQMGCIYELDGTPIRPDDYLNPDGSRPWDMYANVFLGSTPKDTPFDFADTGPGTGTANYDPTTYAPIDNQHLVRRTKANKALIWLDNDPLARLYCNMDAVLGRMTFFEGTAGEIVPKTTSGLGIAWGRGEAWCSDIITMAYATGSDEYRQRTANWFPNFLDALERTQMPNGLFSALDDGKVAEAVPYGDGISADYWAHRSNEQILLALGLRGIQETVGLDAKAAISSSSLAIWDYAWKDGTTGVLDRYPAGPIVGPRYTSKAEIPVGLVDTIYFDPYHVPGAFAQGVLSGANFVSMSDMLTTYAGATDILDAKSTFEGYGTDQIQNRAPALWILQMLFP